MVSTLLSVSDVFPICSIDFTDGSLKIASSNLYEHMRLLVMKCRSTEEPVIMAALLYIGHFCSFNLSFRILH